MNFGINPVLLSEDPEIIKKNLAARISLLEAFSLLFLLAMTLVFTYHHSKGFYIPWDFERSYMLAGKGDFSNFFYGYWITPVFWLLEKIPRPAAYIFWSLLNLSGAFMAGRVLGGKSWLGILSYQMFYVVFYGQITGFILGALALTWWGLINKSPASAGLGLLLASTKPQLGLSIGLILWITSDLSWIEKIWTLLVPVGGLLITLSFYPDFIPNIAAAIAGGKVVYFGNLSLWRYFGPWSLTFLIPPVILKLSKHKRILILILASILAAPYLQQTALLTLFIFPFGWLPVFCNLGFLFPILGWGLLRALIVVPLLIYAMMIYQEFNLLILPGWSWSEIRGKQPDC